MKTIKKRVLIVVAFVTSHCLAQAQQIDKSVYSLLNLDYKGLETVKQALAEGRETVAAQKLLEYYQNRTGIMDTSLNLNNIKASADDMKKANEALEHKLYAHKGFQPSFFYGKDIDWRYWPVKDHELRFCLHRQEWFAPMGRAFRGTGDEKYAKEWVFQYLDWIKKNPLIEGQKVINGVPVTKADLENEVFAWRPLEACGRIPTAGRCLEYFKTSKYFTPEFLLTYLSNLHKHAAYVTRHYSAEGNHLLFQAQYVLYAGIFFPELIDAPKWRKSGIAVLNKEINKQMYDDGMLWELDLGYHQGAIGTFLSAYEMSLINNYGKEFPESYLKTVEKMILATMNTTFPNNLAPHFSDGKAGTSPKLYQNWLRYFPNNKQIAYMASEGKSGELPPYLSNALKNSGFYIFRNGWKKDATVMILKAGPPAEWHNQPDNGTFDLYINGRNFFPDGGCYVYGGDEEVLKKRAWFRQTMVHKTLTLNNANIEEMNSKRLLWSLEGDVEKLVVENQSYRGLKHRRSVFFVDKRFFVIVDEAQGNAKGNVAIHYQFPEQTVNTLTKRNKINTLYNDGNNVCLQVFGPKNMRMVEEEGWISHSYLQKNKRPAFGFESSKNKENSVRFITVIVPIAEEKSAPKISATFDKKNFNEKSLDITVKLGKATHKLGYRL